MEAVMPKKSSLEGIPNQSTPSQHAPKNEHLKCNTPLQKKGNLNLYASTSMQAKNQKYYYSKEINEKR